MPSPELALLRGPIRVIRATTRERLPPGASVYGTRPARLEPDADLMELLEALTRTLALVELSEQSEWSPTSKERIERSLRKAIRALQRGRRPWRPMLWYLFLPAGPIQDTSIDNAWGREFLDLAEVVDRYVRSGDAGGVEPRASEP